MFCLELGLQVATYRLCLRSRQARGLRVSNARMIQFPFPGFYHRVQPSFGHHQFFAKLGGDGVCFFFPASGVAHRLTRVLFHALHGALHSLRLIHRTVRYSARVRFDIR